MIDLHCHILPGIDDGPSTLEESLHMARLAEGDGIKTIVATPHTLNGVYLNPAGEIRSRVNSLQEAITAEGVNLELGFGADVHLCPRMMEKIRSGEAATLNDDRRYILLEFPSQNIPPGVREEIFALKLNGITPVITHPERNNTIQHNLEFLREFIAMGALCQVTAMSVTGDFGEIIRHCAAQMLRYRLVHVIATDAHSAQGRPPLLSRAVDAAADILEDYREAERMVTDIPAAILLGKRPEIPEPVGP